MKIYYMSREYEFAQICSRYLAVYLRLHLKICTLQTRYKKCSVQIDLLFYVFTLYLTISFSKRAQFNLEEHAVKEAFRSKSLEVCADSLGETQLPIGFLHGWNKT